MSLVPAIPCSWPDENANMNMLKMWGKSHSSPKVVVLLKALYKTEEQESESQIPSLDQ